VPRTVLPGTTLPRTHWGRGRPALRPHPYAWARRCSSTRSLRWSILAVCPSILAPSDVPCTSILASSRPMSLLRSLPSLSIFVSSDPRPARDSARNPSRTKNATPIATYAVSTTRRSLAVHSHPPPRAQLHVRLRADPVRPGRPATYDRTARSGFGECARSRPRVEG